MKLLWTVLMLASVSNHPETVKVLLEQERVDVNAKSIYLFSPMLLSII